MSFATGRDVGDRIAALQAPALWTIAGFVLYLVAGIASLFALALVEGPLLAPFGLRSAAGELGLSVRNGLHAIAWGGLVAAVAVPLGRRLVAGIRFSAAGWAMLAVGLLLATVVITLGEEFVRARYGVFDGEYQGLSYFAGPALVAVALATWAALAVPRDGVLVPGAAMLTAAVGLAMALLPSIPGAADGIEADSVPLAVGFILSLVYAGAASIAVVRRLGSAPG